MLGMSFAAVPLYDLFCRVTGFGGTTQISKDIPKIVIDKPVSVRLDTNVQTDLSWNFKTENNLVDVKPGKVYRVNFLVENFSKDPTSGVASYNVSPSSFGPYFNKLGCFCFEKQTLQPGEKKEFVLTFFLDPKVVDDNKTKNMSDVTLSFTLVAAAWYGTYTLCGLHIIAACMSSAFCLSMLCHCFCCCQRLIRDTRCVSNWCAVIECRV